MKRFVVITVIVLLFSAPGWSFDSTPNWNDSPQNWANSPQNWENSPNNWKNSPNNWENSPQRWDNDRIIRDNSGRAQGYIVPRVTGGANIFDLDGNRKAYIPGD